MLSGLPGIVELTLDFFIAHNLIDNAYVSGVELTHSEGIHDSRAEPECIAVSKKPVKLPPELLFKKTHDPIPIHE